MGVLLQRELLGASRDRWFHGSRWMAATGSVGLLWALSLGVEAMPERLGLEVAWRFHLVLCLALLGAGAAIGAPVLLRERLDGTLPLLLLTRQTPAAVVLGKTWGAMARLVALWLATVPAGMVPLVVGSVDWMETLTFVLFEAVMAATGLASGLLASAIVQHPGELARTAASLALGAGALVGGLLLGIRWVLKGPSPHAWPVAGLLYGTGILVSLAWHWPRWLGEVLQRGLAAEPGTAPAPRFADEEDVESVGERAWRRHWSRGEGARVRGRNPLRWLRLREPGRVPSWWLWVGVVVLGWAAAAVMEQRAFPRDDARRWTVELAGWLMLAGMGVLASRGCRREVQSGAMELLLTTGLEDGVFLGREARALMEGFWQPLILHGVVTWLAWKSGQSWVWPERMAWVLVAPWLAGWVGLWVSGLVPWAWRAAVATVALLGLPWGAAWVLERECGLGRAWGSVVLTVGWASMLAGFRWHLGRTWRTRDFVARQLRPEGDE